MKRICQNCEVVKIDTDDVGSFYLIEEDGEEKIVCKTCYDEMWEEYHKAKAEINQNL